VVVEVTVGVGCTVVLGGAAVVVAITVVEVTAPVVVAGVVAVPEAELDVEVVVWAFRGRSAGTGTMAPTRVTDT
jgi:hypothetical protein